jgi:hypothetical protein
VSRRFSADVVGCGPHNNDAFQGEMVKQGMQKLFYKNAATRVPAGVRFPVLRH